MVAISSVLSSTAQDSPSLQRVWETIGYNSCPTDYNFHMHTIASDGQLIPSELIEQAIKIGLKGLAITDHHSVNGYREAQAHLHKLEQNGTISRLSLWTGMEVTARLLDVEVHILGYTFNPDHPALEVYLRSCSPSGKDAQARRVIDSIHQAGGLAVLAHPHRYRRAARELIPVAAELGIDGVEAYYAYGNPYPWQPTSGRTEEILQLAEQYNLYTTCGTDTHGLSLLKRV